MPNPDQQVNKLHVIIETGDDDVRQGSNVYAGAVILQGQQVITIQQTLNDGANWQNGSTHDANMDLPTIQLKDLEGFRITFSSGSCFGCTQDNWNMDKITVTCRLDNGPEDLVFTMEDTPVHRFTGSSSVWEQNLHWV